MPASVSYWPSPKSTTGFRTKADVFVSYARSDRARVAPLVAALEAQGWTVGEARDGAEREPGRAVRGWRRGEEK